MLRSLLLLSFLAVSPLAAQEDGASLGDLTAYENWLREYKSGAFRLMKNGETDREALAKVDDILGTLAKWNDLRAAKRLFEVATLEPEPPGSRSSTEAIDFLRELQPWKVQGLARKHLGAMTGVQVTPWLLKMLRSRNIRQDGHPDQVKAAAVLRILGESYSVEGQLALLEAAGSMPSDLRVKAVSALAHGADPAVAPFLMDLLRDKEPNVRISAANALGRALGKVTDETEHDSFSEEVLARRDEAIKKLGAMFRDKVWQVRSAAAYALRNLKCKAAIPALIDGLKAELRRKKDPWAMDMRIHRILEGMTGQKMLPGSVKPWEQFWKAEGATFAYRKAQDAKRGKVEKEDRYQKFFNLELESDRVLFVVDFSGSMKEPVTLKAKVTGAQPGKPIIKAELVVQELKKLVLSLPDGAMFNIVVFSDEVRVWREEKDGRPSLVRINDDARDDLLGSFLDELQPRGPTNLYGALDRALGFAGRGLYDKYYGLGFDTLYILSDGAPSWGDVTDKDEIRRHVRKVNGLRRLTIHSVTFGQLNDVEFLRKLAEENGGRHIHVE